MEWGNPIPTVIVFTVVQAWPSIKILRQTVRHLITATDLSLDPSVLMPARFMLVWLAALPLAIWDDCGWTTPVILGLVSFFLLVRSGGLQTRYRTVAGLCYISIAHNKALHIRHKHVFSCASFFILAFFFVR